MKYKHSLRYTGRREDFDKETHNFLLKNGIRPTDKMKVQFWDYLQKMEDPENFHFGSVLEYIKEKSNTKK